MIYKLKMPEAYARVEWCKKNLGEDGTWWRHKGHLYFRREKDYFFYVLRWG